MKASIDQCRYSLSSISSLLGSLDDSHRALEPLPGLKTAGWLIGHLAVTGDFGRYLCGAPSLCPRDWRAAFNPGTRPEHDATRYPAMRDLSATFHRVYQDLCGLAVEAEAALRTQPNPYEPAKGDFPMAADFIAYLLGSHLAYHTGQLSMVCRGRTQRRPDFTRVGLPSSTSKLTNDIPNCSRCCSALSLIRWQLGSPVSSALARGVPCHRGARRVQGRPERHVQPHDVHAKSRSPASTARTRKRLPPWSISARSLVALGPTNQQLVVKP